MSFTVRLSSDMTAVEAGATVPLSIEIANRGEEADRFEMQVEGLDPEWTASPEPVFAVAPGETSGQKIFFKPPRASESLAGNYPYVLRVRSLNSGESRTVQGVLQIKGYHHLSMEIGPKKGYMSVMRHNNVFGLTIMNLGNTEHTLQLSGSDPEEACTYEFAQEQVTIGPGQQKVVEVVVSSAKPSVLGPGRLFGFVITARSIQNPNIATSAQAQLELRPALTMGTLFGAILLLLLAVLWFAFRPQPPTVSLRADNRAPVRGQTVTVHWKALNATAVTLEIVRSKDGASADRKVLSDLPLEGDQPIVAGDEDTIVVNASATRESRTVTGAPLTINVQPPPQVVKPKIFEFKASKKEVRLGESVTFSFSYSPDVVKAILEPTSLDVNPPVTRVEVTPTDEGDKDYTLTVQNAAGGITRKKFTVHVRRMSEATIIDFSANPSTILEPSDITMLSWKVTNAVQVQLDDGTGPREVQPNDTLEVHTTKNMIFKLIATDSKGVTTTKTLKVFFKALPPPDNGGEPPVGTTTTTSGGGTGTTTGGNGF